MVLGPSFQPGRVIGPEFLNYGDAPFAKISYLDPDPARAYDIYLTPSGAIWKLDRHEQNYTVGYVGLHHLPECRTGLKTPSDRVIMPAIGLDTNFAGGEGAATRTLLRTNFGCQDSNFSDPYPIANYQGAASERGQLSRVVTTPTWEKETQTAYFKSVPWPWMYYPEVFETGSAAFTNDFVGYGNRQFIIDLMRNALDNVQLEVAVRILPDGTILYAWMWVVLKDIDWGTNVTEGLWAAFDARNTVPIYFNYDTNEWVDVTDPSKTLNGIELARTHGWIGYLLDGNRPRFGIATHFGTTPTAGWSIGIAPGNDTQNSPAILHLDTYVKNLTKESRLFRQIFFSIGTRDDMKRTNSRVLKFTRYARQ